MAIKYVGNNGEFGLLQKLKPLQHNHIQEVIYLAIDSNINGVHIGGGISK